MTDSTRHHKFAKTLKSSNGIFHFATRSEQVECRII